MMWFPFGIGWGMVLWMVVLWGGLVALIVWAIVKLTGSTARRTPYDIARERYARGEISREELEQIKKDLS